MTGPLLKADSQGIEQASRLILRGGVVAFPTETFYGLGADAGNVAALQKTFKIKGREENKPLLLLVGDRTWVPGLVKKIPVVATHLMEKFWPGPLTLIFEASPDLPNLLTGGTGKVGLRISSHPAAQALVQKVGRAITATSANRSGQSSITSPGEVIRSLGKEIEAILDGGETAGGSGSTILDLTSVPPRVLRKGPVSQEQLAPFMGGF
jgi:L-threonylcarbamoyladenylate synthase